MTECKHKINTPICGWLGWLLPSKNYLAYIQASL